MAAASTAARARRVQPEHSLPRSARAVWQLVTAFAVGLVVGLIAALPVRTGPVAAALLGWTAASLVYVGRVGISSWRLDAAGTQRAAVREDPSQPVADVLLLFAAIGSLGAVADLIATASNEHGARKGADVALVIASVIASWLLVHFLFTAKYVRQYFADDGGIDFNTERAPVWTDFAYVAFTVGMTFQIADTDLQTSALRRLALRHMLMSYVLGAVVIAITINLVAGLTK